MAERQSARRGRRAGTGSREERITVPNTFPLFLPLPLCLSLSLSCSSEITPQGRTALVNLWKLCFLIPSGQAVIGLVGTVNFGRPGYRIQSCARWGEKDSGGHVL
jgi:hypothetical protein